MFHQKMLEFLLLVKIKVLNFIRESLNLPSPHSTDAYDASAWDQLHNYEKLGLFTSNVRHWEGGGTNSQ